MGALCQCTESDFGAHLLSSRFCTLFWLIQEGNKNDFVDIPEERDTGIILELLLAIYKISTKHTLYSDMNIPDQFMVLQVPSYTLLKSLLTLHTYKILWRRILRTETYEDAKKYSMTVTTLPSTNRIP